MISCNDLYGVVCTLCICVESGRLLLISFLNFASSFISQGIFVTKLHANGAATNILLPGDKILSVNGQDFTHMEHNAAVASLKQQPTRVAMVIERMIRPTDV
mgnify:FL=1